MPLHTDTAMPSPTDAQQETMEAYLSGALSLSAVVLALAEPIETSYTAGELESPDGQSTEGRRLWTLWLNIIGYAKDTLHDDSSTQTALVNLMAALKSRPNPPPPQGREDLKTGWVWNGSGELWTDLVIFGPSMRKSWNDTPTGCGHDAITAKGWTNLNAFVARLTAAGIQDFSLYAIWSMRETLETENGAETLEKLLPASAMWVLFAGRQLHDSEQEWPAHPLKGDPAMGGPHWNGKSGFCKERWALWKTMFDSITRRSDTNEATKGFAADAVTAMDAIEHKF